MDEQFRKYKIILASKTAFLRSEPQFARQALWEKE